MSTKITAPDNATETVRTFGNVKWFDDIKGYGFIVEANSNREVFVHWKDITQEKVPGQPRPRVSLEEGQQVEMTVVEEDKGPKAYSVVMLD
jgi:CspA family cold shock protein